MGGRNLNFSFDIYFWQKREVIYVVQTTKMFPDFNKSHYIYFVGTAVAQWLMWCAANRKVSPAYENKLCIAPNKQGDRGSSVVKVLCYKSEGRWFDPSWCHWNFSLT